MNALFNLVLKGSAIGVLALVATAAGCSDSDNDDAGTAGSSSKGGSSGTAGKTSTEAGDTGAAGDSTDGGTTSGGTTSGGTTSGGTTSGGAGGDDGSAGGPDIGLGGGDFGGGGDTGTGIGPSVAKFCNTLSFGANHDDTTMILEVGTGADKVTFTATTGECVPADGDACTEIPQGANVPIVMFDADDTDTALDDGHASIGAGQEWVFYTNLGGTEADPFPVIDGGALNQNGVKCEDVTYADIP
jgi:hypothetical protein